MKVIGDLQEKIIANFADIDSRRIISTVLVTPKTANAIGGELSLPQSSLYRKISALRECGLLMLDSFSITPEGKREALYSSSFLEIKFRMQEKEIEVEVVQSPRSLEKRWFELFFGRTKPRSPQQASAAFETL